MYVMYVYTYNIELGQSFTLTTFPSIKHGPTYGSLPDGTWGIIPRRNAKATQIVSLRFLCVFFHE